MKFRCLAFLIFLGMFFSVCAQEPTDYRNYARIGGQIVDAETGDPLPYVQINNVYKHPTKDSLVVQISITDAEGKFTITTPEWLRTGSNWYVWGINYLKEPLQKSLLVLYKIR